MLKLPSLILLCLPLFNSVDEDAAPRQAAVRAPIYDEQADAAAEITAALANAKSFNRRVLIQWGANWCGWCHRLHQLFDEHHKVHVALTTEYDFVLVDVGQFDKNLDLAEQYGADLRGNGLPFLTVLDAEGQVVTHQETSSLESKEEGLQEHDADQVLGFLLQNRVEARKATEYLKGAKALSKSRGKSLFLHFGADWCGNCRQLERWMVDPDVAPILKRNFVELKIDTEQTRGGRKLLDRSRTGEPGGIPWFGFYGTDGQLIIDSNRPSDGKNVGYPKAGENAAHFRAMLQNSGPDLTEAELDTLIAALKRY